MTAARTLSHSTLDKIQSHFGLSEIHNAEGDAYMPLSSPFGRVGELRLFKGTAIHKMVYIGLSVAQFGLDSHMIFAFTSPDSPVPHFTLDSVMNGADNFAFHLDLIPRVDLGATLPYIFHVYSPLDRQFSAAAQLEGLTPARLGPTQYAIMSPWMLAFRATAAAFDTIQPSVDHYLNHWIGLVEAGIPAEVVSGYTGEDFAERDRLNRAAIFNPEVDKVWAQVDRLLGAETSAVLRTILINQEVEETA
jgi:hypothetical protein